MRVTSTYTSWITPVILLIATSTLSNAKCSKMLYTCVESCDCCMSGWKKSSDCGVSIVQYMDICSGDESHQHDPTSYKLESKSIENGEWVLIQQGDIIFPNREVAPQAGESPIRECVRIPISMDNYHLSHRVQFPTTRGGDSYSTDHSGFALRGLCSKEVPPSVSPSTGPSESPTVLPSTSPSVLPSTSPSEQFIYKIWIKVKCHYGDCGYNSPNRVRVILNFAEVSWTDITGTSGCWHQTFDVENVDIRSFSVALSSYKNDELSGGITKYFQESDFTSENPVGFSGITQGGTCGGIHTLNGEVGIYK